MTTRGGKILPGDPIPVANPAAERWQVYGRRALLVALAIAPLFPMIHSRIEYLVDIPRVLFLALVAGILAAIVCGLWARRGAITWRWHPLDTAVACLTGALLAAGLFGVNPRLSLFDPLWTRRDPLMCLGIGLGLYLAARVVLPDRRDMARAIWLMGIMGGIVAAIGLIGRAIPSLAGYLGTPDGRLCATLGNAMLAGTYLATLIPLAVGAAWCHAGARRYAVLAAAGVMVIALVLTETRGAWLGLVLGLAAMAVIAARYRVGLSPRTVGLVIVTGVMLLAGAAMSPPVHERIAALRNLQDPSVQTRFLYMRGALSTFIARPVFGWGPGNHESVYPQYGPPTTLRIHDKSVNLGYHSSLPHNMPLLIASELGLAGLIALGMLLLFGWRALHRAFGDARARGVAFALAGGLIGYACVCLTAFDSPLLLATVWCCLGMLPGLVETAPPVSRPVSPRLLHGVALIIAVGTLALVAQQTAQTALVFTAERQLEQAQALIATQPMRAAETIRRSIATFTRAQWCGVMPEYRIAKRLYFAQADLLKLPVTDVERHQAVRAMEDAATLTLRLQPRDWQILRFYSLQLITWGRVADAQPLVERLVAVEPHSGESRMLHALLLGQMGQLDQAVEAAGRALAVDPENGEILAALAHFQYGQMMGQSQGDPAMAHAIVEGYAKSAARGYALPAPFRLEYALALVLDNQPDRAAEVAITLVGTPAFARFRQSVTAARENPALRPAVDRVLGLLPSR